MSEIMEDFCSFKKLICNAQVLKQRILITGANGFIGSSLCAHLKENGIHVRACVRRERECFQDKLEYYKVSDINSSTSWLGAFDGVDVVVHAAARVHVMRELSLNPIEEFREINVSGTICLARQAAENGVKRFIFLSSLGVNGSSTDNVPFFADNFPAPDSPYAKSKLEAEQQLFQLGQSTGMEIVVVRPPMVYGPNAPGNFGVLVRWISTGLPLPFGRIENRRSFIGVDNLVDLLLTSIRHPSAANQVFLVSDGEDVSTTDLLRRTARAMDKPSRLVPVPAVWLEWGADMVGKRDVAQKLCGSLQVDITKTRELLGWSPPLTLDQGLKRAVEGLRL